MLIDWEGTAINARGDTLSIIADLLDGGWQPDEVDANLYVHPNDSELTLFFDVMADDLIPSDKLMSLLCNGNFPSLPGAKS